MRRDTALSNAPLASASTQPTKADSSRRSPTGALHRLITRQPSLPASSSFPIPVRPEARRAYEVAEMDSGTSHQQRAERRAVNGKSSNIVDPSTDSTRLLQQAANYATLSSAVPASNDTRLAPPISVASSVVRRLLVRTKSGRHSQGSSLMSEDDALEALHVAGGISTSTLGYNIEDEAWETAPRLSMSSTASSGASEVKTPESVSANLHWQPYSTDGAGSGVRGAEAGFHSRTQDTRRAPCSPGLIDMGDAMRDPDGLAAMGFGAAQSAARSSVNPALINAAQHMDEGPDEGWPQHVVDGEGASQTNSASASRSATIKIKRPDTLLRLPSISYRTDATVTPPRVGSPAVEEPLPDVDSADGYEGLRDRAPWNMTSFVDSIDLGTDKHYVGAGPITPPEVRSGEASLPPSHPLAFAYKFDRVKQRTDSNDSVGPPTSVTSVVSSDSWRSLLPEDDPYFIPDPSSASSSSVALD